MIFCLFAWIVGLIYTLIKGKYANISSLGPLELDIISILTGYLFLAYGSQRAALFAFVQGFDIDIYSGGPQGIFSFAYFSIFLIFVGGSKFFNMNEPKGQFFLVFIAAGFKKIFIILSLWASSNDITISVSLIGLSALSAFITALAAPIVFFIFNRARVLIGLGEET